jgi:hypothetical protein
MSVYLPVFLYYDHEHEGNPNQVSACFRPMMTDLIYSWVFGQSGQAHRKQFQKAKGRIKVLCLTAGINVFADKNLNRATYY